MILPILSSFFVFLAVGAVAVWRFQQANAHLDARLRARSTEQQAQSLALRDVPFEHRVVLPVVDGIAQRGNRRSAAGVHRADARARSSPPASRWRWSRSLRSSSSWLCCVPGTVPGRRLGGSGARCPQRSCSACSLFALLGALLPFLWLRRRARRRRLIIWRGLPDAFDLMTTCVEAGLGLDAAFQKVADKLGGPVADRVRGDAARGGDGQELAATRMRDMGERTGVPDLQIFANTIVQAEELGTSLGAALRIQAADLDGASARQHAEEEARRAPSKMVFPLVFFILPSLFVVILGPVAIELIQGLRQTRQGPGREGSGDMPGRDGRLRRRRRSLSTAAS